MPRTTGCQSDGRRAWLQQRYANSLEQLNRAWGTVFWNQTYSDWAQVKLTGPTPTDSPNPHQALDEKRFFSDSAPALRWYDSDGPAVVAEAFNEVLHAEAASAEVLAELEMLHFVQHDNGFACCSNPPV